MSDPFTTFHNADLKVRRVQKNKTYRGEEKDTEDLIMSCRADVQRSAGSGESAERARDVFTTADIVVYPEENISPVTPEDRVEITTDSGTTITGTVDNLLPISNSLYVST
ncbi:hypothetical protein OSG_eHP25_00035 [environmental Halophage eHP-25]|nr:hypothetical protein OSG_eHP25_00035 [environmental Halophage eHP-25]